MSTDLFQRRDTEKGRKMTLVVCELSQLRIGEDDLTWQRPVKPGPQLATVAMRNAVMTHFVNKFSPSTAASGAPVELGDFFCNVFALPPESRAFSL